MAYDLSFRFANDKLSRLLLTRLREIEVITPGEALRRPGAGR